MGRLTWRIWLVTATFAVTVIACGGGGGGGGGGATGLKGAIILPTPGQCAGCSIGNVDFGVVGLVQNQAPLLIATGKTNAQGMFNTGDLTVALSNPANGSVDTNGNGMRTLVVVANVSSTAGIGGVESIPTGATLTKNFNATTQVACEAAVLLTQGTTTPCTVQATCPPADPTCIATVDPDTLDSQKISNLEQAADFISADVVFPDTLDLAACATITCTNSGTTQATAACVTAAFQPPVP